MKLGKNNQTKCMKGVVFWYETWLNTKVCLGGWWLVFVCISIGDIFC